VQRTADSGQRAAGEQRTPRTPSSRKQRRSVGAVAGNQQGNGWRCSMLSRGWVEVTSPFPYTHEFWCHARTPQGRQFKPTDVPRNQDLVELCPEKLAASPALSSPTLPTPPPFQPGLYRRICARIVLPRGVNLSLWTSLAIKIWWSYRLTCSLPPPDSQRCLHRAHFTAASTDEYAPA
jgi:hypothetical protein